MRPPGCTQGRRNGFPPLLATLGALLLLSCTTAAPAPGPTVPPARAVATAAATMVQAEPATTTGATQPAATLPASGRASEPSWLADYAAAATRLRGDAAEWERLTDAAMKEGTVVVAGPGFPGLRTGLTEGFQRAYGITLEYLGLGAGEITTRVERESQMGRGTIDVYLGGVSTCWPLAARGYIDAVNQVLVDPRLFDASAWRYGHLRVILPAPDLPKDFYCGFQFAEFVVPELLVNAELVKPDAIRSWKDLLQPAYKGKIVSFDPRRAGSAQSIVGYLAALFGEQYLQDLYIGQAVSLTADYRQLAEWVARGQYPIGLGLVPANIEPLRAQGLPLERVFPTDGAGALTGGFGTVYKIKGGPNPAAAAVFMNWLGSREAQEIWEREMLETSLRTDTPHTVPDYVVPRPGTDYPVNDYHPDYFFSKRAPAIASMQELLGR